MENRNYWLERKGIFEELFCITRRLKDKRLYLFGLNDDTKKAMMFLASLHISIKGFLISDEQKNLNGIEYITRPVRDWEWYKNHVSRDSIILDVFGDRVEEINMLFHTNAEVLFHTTEKNILVYGAGNTGRVCMEFLERCHIKVSGICDQNADMKQACAGYPFYLPDELSIEQNGDMFVIIAINDAVIVEHVKRFSREKGFSKISYFNSIFFESRFSHYFWCGNAEEAFPIFGPDCLRYIYCHLTGKKEIYLYGSEVGYIIEVYKILKAIGIRINHAITEKQIGDIEIPSDLKIINAYDLLYAEGDYVIWTLPGEADQAKDFIKKSALPEERFLYSSTGPLLLNRTYIPDIHLGYADSRGIIKRRNCNENETVIKAAILGGSTSDYDLYYEKSWPACLLEIARKADINMECMVAATAGNISMQEVIMLIRDILQEEPDVVISYSRINEMILSCPDYRRSHKYQESLFNILTQSSKHIDFFNLGSNSDFYMGMKNSDAVRTWIDNERIMHAICEEFQIPFLAFAQPRIYDKMPKTINELECIEHLCDDERTRVEKDTEFIKRINIEIESYSWIYNYTHIFDEVTEAVFFDGIHLLEYGNRILAHKIFPLIMKEMKKGEQHEE